MARSTPITMTFPPFAGMVRRLVLANVAVFFAFALLDWLAPQTSALLTRHILLQPLAIIHGELWQLVTYAFYHAGLLSILFSMLTLWLCGSILEGSYGSRWLAELYFTAVIGGALLASLLSFTHILRLSPESFALGPGAGIFGILVGLAMRFGDLEFLLWFTIRIRAKYLVAIYILINVAVLLKSSDGFSALLALCGGLCGYLYVTHAPRRGLAFNFSEQLFGLRNAYYRAKRRRAARKFEVYMGKQGRHVHFDKEGHFLDPDDPKKNRDPNDKRWMN